MELGRLGDEVHGSEKWPMVGALVFHALTLQVFFSLCQTCNWPAAEMTIKLR